MSMVRLGHGELTIGLTARPRGQPVQEYAARRVLDLERAAHQIHGQRCTRQVRAIVHPPRIAGVQALGAGVAIEAARWSA
jgi:hypothetical protein